MDRARLLPCAGLARNCAAQPAGRSPAHVSARRPDPPAAAAVLQPAPEDHVRRFLEEHKDQVRRTNWKLEAIQNVPAAIRDQVGGRGWVEVQLIKCRACPCAMLDQVGVRSGSFARRPARVRSPHMPC